MKRTALREAHQVNDGGSLREHILSAEDIGSKIEHVPEWKCDIKLLMLTAKERDDYFKRCSDGKDGYIPELMVFHIIIACASDPVTGKRIFTVDDIEALKNKNGAVISRIARAAMKLNRLRNEDVGEAEKN